MLRDVCCCLIVEDDLMPLLFIVKAEHDVANNAAIPMKRTMIVVFLN